VAAELERSDKLGTQYSLFFTARLNSGAPTIVWYQRTQSETEAQGIYMVDMLDLDGQANELIALRQLYENYQYEVYKRSGCGWEQVFRSEVLGCE
jgi:hypothetical protein